MSTPKLRFPEFAHAGEWEVVSLQKISERIVDKVGTEKLPTVSISAGLGFVLQAEKFGRDISGEQYKNYLVLLNGDFAYNKGNSKRYPQGCIYKLTEYPRVAAPNAFICFRMKENYTADFFKQYFEFNTHGNQLKKFITSGARSDGLLNIKPEDFFSIVFFSPIIDEQQKIADCLSSLDDLIAAHKRKFDALKTHKKGLMQNLFPAEGETVPRLRFPEFENAGEWEEKTLTGICRMQSGKFIPASEILEYSENDTYPCFGGNGLRGFTKTFNQDGNLPLIGRQGALCGNITFANGKFYATEHAVVCSPEKGIRVSWLYYQLLIMNLNQYATGQAQPGLSVENLEKIPVLVPFNESEQQKIADCLSSLDGIISAEAQKIDVLKMHKKALMQQLFPQGES